ncbi:MAG: porin family protein [Salinivirgaceae bacterium]
MNKRLILITLGILLIIHFATAQEFNSGVYGGITVSQLDGDTFSGYNKAGIVGGAFVNRYMSKKMGWQLGIRYISKGSKHADSEAGEYYKSVLQYIESPITARYFIRKDIDLEGGLALGYLMKSLEDTDGNGLLEPKPPFNKFELSGLAGINYHWNKQFSFGAFFSYSLTPARPYSSGYSVPMDRGQYNNVIYFAFCYTISSWK